MGGNIGVGSGPSSTTSGAICKFGDIDCESATFNMRPGLAPSGGTCLIPSEYPPANYIPKYSLHIGDGNAAVKIKNLIIRETTRTPGVNNTGVHNVSFCDDRYFAFHYGEESSKEPIRRVASGRYNWLLPDGVTYREETVKSNGIPYEWWDLVVEAVEILGLDIDREERKPIDYAGATLNPKLTNIDWYGRSVATILEELLAIGNWAISQNIKGRLYFHRRFFASKSGKLPLPDKCLLSHKKTYRNISVNIPEYIIVVGGRNILERKIDGWEPVCEFDGRYLVGSSSAGPSKSRGDVMTLAELAAAWGYSEANMLADCFGKTPFHQVPDNTGKTEDDAASDKEIIRERRDLLKRCYGKWWRIPGHNEYTETPSESWLSATKNADKLPLEDRIVTCDPQGHRLPPLLYGTWVERDPNIAKGSGTKKPFRQRTGWLPDDIVSWDLKRGIAKVTGPRRLVTCTSQSLAYGTETSLVASSLATDVDAIVAWEQRAYTRLEAPDDLGLVANSWVSGYTADRYSYVYHVTATNRATGYVKVIYKPDYVSMYFWEDYFQAYTPPPYSNSIKETLDVRAKELAKASLPNQDYDYSEEWVYAGCHPVTFDGWIQDVSYEAGPGGIFTHIHCGDAPPLNPEEVSVREEWEKREKEDRLQQYILEYFYGPALETGD